MKDSLYPIHKVLRVVVVAIHAINNLENIYWVTKANPFVI